MSTSSLSSSTSNKSDHGRRHKQLAHAVAQPLHAPLDHIAHALRQSEGGCLTDRPPLSCIVEHEHPRLDKAAQNLADEERVATRLAGDLAREFESVFVEVVARRRAHHRGHIFEFKPIELEPLHAVDLLQIRQCRRERMVNCVSSESR